jgi:hypothetical protein
MRKISTEQMVENEDATRTVGTSRAWFMSNSEQVPSGLLYDTHANFREFHL